MKFFESAHESGEVAVPAEAEAVDEECAKVMAAVTDRRENGGTRKKVRAAAIALLSTMSASLTTDK